MSGGFDVVFLNCWLAWGIHITTNYQNSVISTLLDCVFKNDRVIVDNLNGTVIDLHFIHSYESIDPRVDDN